MIKKITMSAAVLKILGEHTLTGAGVGSPISASCVRNIMHQLSYNFIARAAANEGTEYTAYKKKTHTIEALDGATAACASTFSATSTTSEAASTTSDASSTSGGVSHSTSGSN
eukprot:6115080-Amphidinium_carterae.1